MASVRAFSLAVLSLALAGCGARSPLHGEDTPADASADVGADADVVDADPGPSLELSAAFSISLRAESESARNLTSAIFWRGPERPTPGGRGGRSIILDAGESITLNGAPLTGGWADWGYLYQGASLPEPADGRWVFRLTRRGRTVAVTITLPRSRFVDFPTGRTSLGTGLTFRWAPPFAEGTERRAYLTSCVLNERTDIGLDRVTFQGRLSAMPCRSHAQVYGTVTVALGAPFEGGSASASVAMDREIDLAP